MKPVLSDLHNHTTYCDGRATPRAMIETALSRGFTDIGLLAHGYVPFDRDYSLNDADSFVAELAALRAEYAGRINVYRGIEQDFHSPEQEPARYDYILGSTHYLRDDERGKYWFVDGSLDEVRQCISTMFHGDAYAWAAAYYANVADNARQLRPTVIAHFDLLMKNNYDGGLFDEADTRYRRAALDALDLCLESGALFEVNTGPLSRNYGSHPYPNEFLLRQLQKRGARLTLGADAHRTEHIGYNFAETQLVLKDYGFTSVWVWQGGQFVEQDI